LLPNTDEIRTRRKNIGITQAILSELTGISRTSILKLEKGQSDLGYSKVKKIFDTIEHLENSRITAMELGSITLEDIHTSPITHINTSDLVYSVWATMIETNFSQLLIKNGSNIVGSITERIINRAIMERGIEVNSLKVQEVMDDPFPIFSVNTPVLTIISVLQKTQAVLTMKNGEVVGIVTNSDIGNILNPKFKE